MANEREQIIEHLRAAKELLDQVEENAASSGLMVDNIDITHMGEVIEDKMHELISIGDFEFHRVGGDDVDEWDDNDWDVEPVDEF